MRRVAGYPHSSDWLRAPMLDQSPKRISKYEDLYTLLKLTTADNICGTDPVTGATQCYFAKANVFVYFDHAPEGYRQPVGVRKLRHSQAKLLLEHLVSFDWKPGMKRNSGLPNQETWKSPLLQLAYEATDGEEQSCLQDSLGCDGVVHAPEADEVPRTDGLSF